ncbi:MAG: hypothetical protein Q7J98_11155 [Kiritimatiellia bacterium]|nr:hypothetical protein [Kiritimatiellia bacterium]
MPDFDIHNEATALVLGAGASHPYGFPLSAGLKKLILEDQDNTLLACLKQKGHDDGIIKQFKEALRYGDYGTIDLFLEQKTSFREIGAYFIAHSLRGLSGTIYCLEARTGIHSSTTFSGSMSLETGCRRSL